MAAYQQDFPAMQLQTRPRRSWHLAIRFKSPYISKTHRWVKGTHGFVSSCTIYLPVRGSGGRPFREYQVAEDNSWFKDARPCRRVVSGKPLQEFPIWTVPSDSTGRCWVTQQIRFDETAVFEDFLSGRRSHAGNEKSGRVVLHKNEKKKRAL